MNIPVIDMHSHFLINAYLFRKRFDRRHGRAWLWNPLRNAYDLPRAREGGVAGATFTMYDPGLPRFLGGGMKMIRAMRRRFDVLLSQCEGDLVECSSAAGIRRAMDEGKFPAPLAVEGMDVIGGDLKNVQVLHDMGVRMGTVVHFVTTDLADAVWGKARHGGLSDLGKRLVSEMQRLGMIVDLSHASHKTFWDAIALAESPYVVSHTGATGAGAGSRGLDDNQLCAIRDLHGVAGVIFFPWYLKRHSILGGIELVARHTAYIAEKIGVEHVGIGTDADSPIWLPFDFKEMSNFPLLTEGLRKHGLTDADLRLIYSENYLRVLDATDPAFRAGGRAGVSRHPSPETAGPSP
ncbi:MAG: membrane dipeptidase [Deltaproteobacteria bacterium]|nr:membrane dipeptidase [Deltaproteobacteria bacterium]